MKAFWNDIVIHKFSKPIVLIFLFLVSLLVSFVVARMGIIGGAILLVLIVALPALYAVVAFPKFGLSLFIIVAFIINDVSRITDAPVGTLMDALNYLLILGFFVKQRNERRWDYFDTPISYLMLAWLVFNLLEVINPAAASMLAWVYTVRTVAFIMLMYFVFLYHIRTKSFIKLLFKIWLIFALIGAIYGYIQEHIGFFPYQQKWLNSDPQRIQLLFIFGHMRKFGIFSDPVVFAYIMVISSLLCVGLMFSTIQKWKKVVLGCLTFFFIMTMVYSGTRGAYVLLPAAGAMLAVLKYNKTVLKAAITVGVIFFILIKMPTSNGALVRFQSAFKPSNDASFNVRAENQRRIKPYILSHPIGGGLGSVGIWGIRFAPHSYLAKFPPDSGYVRVAVEMGYIGLLLFCVLNFVILYQGLLYYYLIKDPDLKAYCLAMILVIFALDIGNYPQQAIVQYPTNILYFLSAAIINITMRMDIELRKQTPAKTLVVAVTGPKVSATGRRLELLG